MIWIITESVNWLNIDCHTHCKNWNKNLKNNGKKTQDKLQNKRTTAWKIDWLFDFKVKLYEFMSEPLKQN